MPFIIAEPCVGTCDTACVEVCPVDCIHGPYDKEGMGQEARPAAHATPRCRRATAAGGGAAAEAAAGAAADALPQLGAHLARHRMDGAHRRRRLRPRRHVHLEHVSR